MNMRLLAINQFYWPDLAPTSVLLTDVCEHLASRGHDVHVISDRARYAGAHSELRQEESRHGVSIHRIDAMDLGRSSLLRRGANAVSFQAAALTRALTVPRPDVILCKSTPPLVASLGL